MKLISGLVRPERVDDVKAALNHVNVFQITVTQVHDHGPHNHGTAVWRAREYRLPSSLKMEIRLVVHDDDVDQAIGAIIRAARTGHSGDGCVCVMPVDHRYDIVTGQREVS
jgi:nitrogen regulatory protein P-II 1